MFLSIGVGFVFGLPAGLLTLGGLVGVRALAEIPIARFIHGNLEYRVYEDAVIAYDTFLDAPQWRGSSRSPSQRSRRHPS